MLKLFALITLCYINYSALTAFSVWTNRSIKVKELPLFKRVAYTTIFTLLWLCLVVMITLTIAYCISVIF